jgi:hypothetical protein
VLGSVEGEGAVLVQGIEGGDDDDANETEEREYSAEEVLDLIKYVMYVRTLIDPKFIKYIIYTT